MPTPLERAGRRDAPPASTLRRSAALCEAVLWTFSAACLATVLWWLGDAWWFQTRAERQWRDEHAAHRQVVAASVEPASSFSPPRFRAVAAGAPLGRLTIPRLDLAVMVAEGTTDDVLVHAVGHLATSAKPGSPGNVVLAGHRDSFFRPLEAIRQGDRIDLDDGRRVHRYRVSWVDVVEPDRLDVAAPTPEPVLTLITCYPFRYVGTAPQRFVVRARELEARSGRDELPGG